MTNKTLIYRPLQLLELLLIGFIMNSLTPTPAEAAGHIKVTREVLLENGVSISPNQIIHTKDGGYVVAGRIGNVFAWATRLDAKGNMQWRYQAPVLNDLPYRPDATFEGAVTLGDDSTLLCGYKTVSVPGGKDVVGILTHIDKAGKVLSDRVIRPQEPGVFGGSYLKGCFPWAGGFALIGDTYRVSDSSQAPDHTERFFWLFGLDAAGNVKWEKLIPNSTGGFSNHIFTNALGTIYESLDQDLVMGSSRVSQGGEIKNIELKETTSDFLIPQIIADSNGHWKVDQRIVLPLTLFKTELRPKVAYSVPDHSLVEFGSIVRNNVYYAAIEWQSPDQKQSETFEFGDTLWVNDAIPTGVPGEFVTVRQASPLNLKVTGMFLSFIQIK